MSVTRITFAVITRNEAQRIEGCLSQAAWADEILVLDSCSLDRTVEICKEYTGRVYQNEFLSFPNQRNRALELATGDWVLFVDADERVTPELAGEVRCVVEQVDSPVAGYWIPRRNIIWGKWVKHGGWYPDYQLRLLRRGKCRYDESRRVHELVILEGPAGHLSNPFIHYNYQTVSQFLQKQSLYSEYEARTLFDTGVRAKPWGPVLQPVREVKRRLWDLQGYRDGGHGLLLAVLLGYYHFIVYSRLLRMSRG